MIGTTGGQPGPAVGMHRAPLWLALKAGRSYVGDPNMWEGSWQNWAHAMPGSVMAGFAGAR